MANKGKTFLTYFIADGQPKYSGGGGGGGGGYLPQLGRSAVTHCETKPKSGGSDKQRQKCSNQWVTTICIE